MLKFLITPLLFVSFSLYSMDQLTASQRRELAFCARQISFARKMWATDFAGSGICRPRFIAEQFAKIESILAETTIDFSLVKSRGGLERLEKGLYAGGKS